MPSLPAMRLLLLLWILQLCSVRSGKRGVDLTLPMTVKQWGDLNVDFAIVRVVKHTGEIDHVGIRNLRNAQAANLTDLAGYMYPCIPSSYFAQVEGIECLSAEGQLEALKDAMQDNLVSLEQYAVNNWPPTNAPTFAPTLVNDPTHAPTFAPTGQPSGQPTAQPTRQPTAQPSSMPSLATAQNWPTGQPTGQPTVAPSTPPPTFPVPTAAPSFVPGTQPLELKRIFLMVEDESPPRYFSADQLVNQAYFRDLALKAYSYGYQLGVFTTLRYWSELMETNSGGTVNFSRENVPLWIPRFDRIESMDFFVPFGGWTKPYMKQYWGGSSPARRLDVTWRLNQNYIVNALNTTTIDPL